VVFDQIQVLRCSFAGYSRNNHPGK
jgi:hypothetical protein